MNPATLRRILVVGVCLVGVGCLYLVPSMAGSLQRTGPPPSRDAPAAASPQPAEVSIITADLASPQPSVDPAPRRTSGRPAAPGAVPSNPAGHREDDRSAAATPAATAVAAGEDDIPPAPVGRLSVSERAEDHLTVSWGAGSDDVGVVGYQVLLNGFLVLVTHQPRATLAWFNDTDTHVIQVRALDAAGNAGPVSPTLLVTRPEPESTPRPTSSATDSPTPTAPTPTTTTSPSPTDLAGENTDTKNAAPSPTVSQESGTEEDGS